MEEKTLLPHQVRVVEEKRELDEKIGKLTLFFDTDTFSKLPQQDKHLLLQQRNYMEMYSNVLKIRIERF